MIALYCFFLQVFTVHVVKLLKRSSKTLTDSVEDIEEELMKVTVIKLLYDTQRKFIMEIEFFKTEETTQHEWTAIMIKLCLGKKCFVAFDIQQIVHLLTFQTIFQWSKGIIK